MKLAAPHDLRRLLEPADPARGVYGRRRFDQVQRALEIGRNILTDRVGTLVGEGLPERAPYQERPTRYEYRLTAGGRDTFPVLLAMATWRCAHTLGPHESSVAY
ncbi:winged helix-turn-helix transcriptional regulator [Microlunatus antarcticus]|uniref:winged helix-turn-helix transcriptional regulator n=1 Tax=Microlunatus antarcticus TaxID=53388 RepID=UPI001E5CE132|nr:helix-turn-helix domain-containing protein [Microlunatus antarcticus]